MRVAVVGGGPAGLFFARQLRMRRPDARTTVYEQNSPEATFGFGVTLGGGALATLEAADRAVIAALRAEMVFDDQQLIRLDSEDVLLDYAQAGGSITRVVLLRILRDACLEAGVEFADVGRIEDPADLADKVDLLVGADGANSIVRASGAAFADVGRTLTNHFAWYGVAKALKPNALVFRNACGGRFVAHYYAYTPTMSTFVPECDHETWLDAGLEAMSDDERRALIEQIFARELGGEPLVENRSIWRQFAATRTEKWYSGNVVLIGDALRAAHFSIGSGTRIAMEDALALAQACAEAGEIADALPLYVKRRKPIRDRFGDAAERSFTWYENLKSVMAQPALDFAHDFLTRTGRVDDERLTHYAPRFAERWRRERGTVGAVA